jgi:hypothetical protein
MDKELQNVVAMMFLTASDTDLFLLEGIDDSSAQQLRLQRVRPWAARSTKFHEIEPGGGWWKRGGYKDNRGPDSKEDLFESV